MILIKNFSDHIQSNSNLQMANVAVSPIMEEGLLIGIAIVAILIVLGIIFGVFDWLSESFSSLFDQFGIYYLLL